MKSNKISRRSFIKQSSFTLAAASSIPLISAKNIHAKVSRNQWPGRSVLNFNEDAVSMGSPDYDVIKQMIDESIMMLTGESTVAAGWESVFSDITVNDKIAIKINASYTLKNTMEVLKATVEGLKSMCGGTYPASNITIFDHGGPNTINFSSIYNISSNMPGVNTSQGSDGRPHSDPNAGNRNYPDCVEQAKYLIDIPVIKNHPQDWSGKISITFKSHIGTYRSGHSGFDAGDLVTLRSGVVKEKCCLCIVDSIKGTKAGHNGSAQTFPIWTQEICPGTSQNDPCTIIMSTDPVATDYLAREILRLDMNDPTMGSGANDIVENAQNAGLGIGDENDPNWDYREIVNGIPTNIIEKGIPVVNKNLTLMQNHPNPASTYTTIRFSVPHKMRTGNVNLEIANAAGKTIRQEKLNTTRTQFTWDLTSDSGRRVPNGIYIYKLSTSNHSINKQMIVRH